MTSFRNSWKRCGFAHQSNGIKFDADAAKSEPPLIFRYTRYLNYMQAQIFNMADRQDLLIPQQGKKQPRPLTSSPSLEDSRQAGKQHYCNILPTDISTQIEQP